MGKGIALLVALAAACAPAGCIADFECTGDGCPDSGGATGDGGVEGDGTLDTSPGPEAEGDTGADTGAWNEGGPMCTAPPKVRLCNGACVDPTSDTSNCGGCDVKCQGPASMHGMATCAPAAGAGAVGGADAGSGVCGISCATGYHACGGDCLSNADSPSAASDPCVIDDAFGTFVAPVASGGSDTNGSGTKAAPFATVGHALANLKHGRVYLCNATYSEQVAIKSAVGVYGGLACPGGDAGASAWSYVGGHAQIAGPQNAAAVTISAGSGAVDVEDVAVSAPNASGQDTSGNGNSSIAVLVSGSNDVALRRCALSAGNGADAVQSQPPGQSNYTNGPIAPSGSANTGTTGGAGGATTGANACGSGSSTGGAGGTVGMNGGGAGSGSSTPAATVGASTGYDGKGGSAGAGGDTGASGAAGNGGVAATGYGKLTASGWTPSQGGNGGAGGPGQGGGGGGIKNAPQAGGTGGGAGGCGGAGGLGGAGGGASIALASVASTVTLDNGCTLSTGTGGNGQPGGDGQVGQEGGLPGTNSLTLAGGQGGNGAGGSGGAGGTGGSSVCIVFSASAPSSMASCTSTAAGTPGSAGAGNSGGDNGDANPGASGNSGSAGLAGTTTSPMQLN